MDTVDIAWIKSRLSSKRGAKAELAEAIGITPVKLSNILSGKRKILQDEAALIREFFGELPNLNQPEPRSELDGFGESTVQPITPKPGSHAETLLQMARNQSNHPALFRISKAMPNANLEAGDALLVDLKGTANEGDLVVCTIIETDGTPTTHVRHWFDPWLMAGDNATKLNPETGNAAILGTVIGSIRGDFLELTQSSESASRS